MHLVKPSIKNNHRQSTGRRFICRQKQKAIFLRKQRKTSIQAKCQKVKTKTLYNTGGVVKDIDEVTHNQKTNIAQPNPATPQIPFLRLLLPSRWYSSLIYGDSLVTLRLGVGIRVTRNTCFSLRLVRNKFIFLFRRGGFVNTLNLKHCSVFQIY